MLHTKTPDETGWYWIEDGDGQWLMANLDCDDDEPRLLAAFPAGRSWLTLAALAVGAVRRWIGPLSQPAGDFGSTITEFTIEQHEEAAAEGKALVMAVADFTHCREEAGHGGTVVVTGKMDAEKAMQTTAAIFKNNGQ